jgi:tRNA(His) guanylyltransferase
MDKTNLGDRIKSYEADNESRLPSSLPIVVRLDGRSFSKFTKGMKRPFDNKFRQAMIEVTKYLIENTHAKIGYTQSDEISLVLYSDNQENGSVIFDGRVQKIASNFAAMASVKFLMEMQKHFPEKISDSKTLPSFDARVFSVPNKTEAMNSIFWRVQDAQKNSISMVAHAYFSHKSLQGLTGEDKKFMLLYEKDISWDDYYSSAEKQGVFIRKEKVRVQLEKENLEKIPVDKRPEGGWVTRGKIVEIEMPDFLKVTNRNEVIFDGAEPKLD